MSAMVRPRRFKHLGHGKHRADAHFVGLAAGHGKAQEAAQGLQALALRHGLVHHHAGAGTVAELAGIAGADQTPGQGRAHVADAFIGGAGADAFVVFGHGHFLAAQAHHLVGHAGGDGDGRDLILEQARLQRGGGLLLAAGAVVVHALAADAVALATCSAVCSMFQ
jgi:hypothetical protein